MNVKKPKLAKINTSERKGKKWREREKKRKRDFCSVLLASKSDQKLVICNRKSTIGLVFRVICFYIEASFFPYKMNYSQKKKYRKRLRTREKKRNGVNYILISQSQLFRHPPCNTVENCLFYEMKNEITCSVYRKVNLCVIQGNILISNNWRDVTFLCPRSNVHSLVREKRETPKNLSIWTLERFIPKSWT